MVRSHLNLVSSSILALVLVILLLVSCRKDDIISTEPSYKLEFSNDTIIFDTVFTTIGSTTQFLQVYNRNNERIKISQIYLAGGTNSQFQLNIDGSPVVSIHDIELASGDSLFIFVKVTVDPTNSNSPLVVTDSVVFETNGNIQDVDLVAWGQDAHFFVGNLPLTGSYSYSIIAGEGETVEWIDDKPYVIYGWAVVDSTGRLNIGPGVNIYFHQNSGLWIYHDGSIHVYGEKDSLVIFQGDRLETDYDNLPGQWDRILIDQSNYNSEFNYALIKNGFIGIQTGQIADNPRNGSFTLNNTIIENMSLWGLFAFAYKITASNSVFINCAEKTLFLTVGGSYDFRQCTFANYWTSTVRLDPSFIVSNNLTLTDADGNPIQYTGDLQKGYFGNCIIYGSNQEEIIISDDDQSLFNYHFDHCLLRTELSTTDTQFFTDCIKNIFPEFVNIDSNNYRIDTLSPAIDAGSQEVITTSLIEIINDLDGNSRISDNGPDIGTFEFVPQTR